MLLVKQIHNWITKKPSEAYQIPVLLHHGMIATSNTSLLNFWNKLSS